MIKLSLSLGSFLLSSGFRLLVEFKIVLLETHFLSAIPLFSVRSKFVRALMTGCFAVEWSVSPVMMYFRKLMLVTRWVENLLKVVQVRRDCSANMML